MVDQAITEAPGNVGLEAFDIFGLKFDHFARAQIDEVVVMAVGHLLIARAAVAELMPFDDAGVLKQLHRPINRRDRDAIVNR